MAANSGAAAADGRLDLNTGKGWSEMDLFDLAITVRMKTRLSSSRSSWAGHVAKCATKSRS